MSVPVYLVTGYLESGKTTLIKNTLSDPMFNSGEKTCLIVCEQGEEEYDDVFLKEVNAVVEYIDDESELTTDFFASLDEKYHMDRVFIEYNGTMKLSGIIDVPMPFDWQLVQIITTIDASTYELMLKNMRSIFYDQMQMSDLVIFNRCESSINKSFFQTSIQSMSRGAMIVYEYLDGTVDQEVIAVEFEEVDGRMMISHQDYGFFYLQAMEKPQQYDAKKISIKGCVLKREEDGNSIFVLYRKAMVCCEDDIQIFGLKVLSKDAMKYHDHDWVEVEGIIEVMYDDEFEGEVCVIHAEKISRIEPYDDLVTFN